jgi:hypothetical protein
MNLFSFNIKKAILFIYLLVFNIVSHAQNGLNFNGTNSYVEIPYSSTNNTTQFTVEFWAKVNGGAGTIRAPLSNRGYPPTVGYNFYADSNNTWTFTAGNNTGVWSYLPGPAIVLGQWTHLAASYDGTTLRFYVNGVLENSLVTAFTVNTSRPLRIGAGTTETTPNYYFPGVVDEVKIWNYARNVNQINNYKNINLPVPQTGLQSYYQFESGTATSKTGINNGTLINSPTSVAGINFTSAPSTISGNNVICAGESTTLTASGGTTNSNAIEVWYAGVCGGEAYSQGWDTQPGAPDLYTTTVNSCNDGILKVTSTSADPRIHMFGIGSFNPNTHKYINFRYRVVSGTAENVEIFFLNSTYTTPTGGISRSTPLVSDNAWHVGTIDMSTHPNWTTGGNITGWRYDYATATGVTMDIDFIQLGTSPIIGTGPSINVTPNTNTTYFVNRKGPFDNTACASQLVTVNPLPIPSFTTQPAATVAINTDVTFSTEAGQTNYVWTIPGILNVDYSITSGGTSAHNSIVLKWLTTGSKTVTINYTNINNCVATTATSSLPINARKKGLTVNGIETLNVNESVNRNGAKGTDTTVDRFGSIIISQPGSGLTSSSAATSAKQIKQNYPSSPNGVYWITNTNINGGTPFQIYADMTTDGGGWMLLNVGAGYSSAPQVNTVTSPNVLGYLLRTTVIELAKLSTDVQLRSGASSTSYAHKTTSTSPLAIGALKNTSNDVNGDATWANGASATFVVNSGTWGWAYCCPGSAAGWPKMYHSSNFTNNVHWFADDGIGRKHADTRDAWFSTWIR